MGLGLDPHGRTYCFGVSYYKGESSRPLRKYLTYAAVIWGEEKQGYTLGSTTPNLKPEAAWLKAYSPP